MGDLVSAVADLGERLQQFADSGDHRLVLAPEALELGCAVLAAVSGAETIAPMAELLRLVGFLCYFRGDALTTGPEPDKERAGAEEATAMQLFTVLYRVRPDLVPPSALGMVTILAEAGFSGSPAAQATDLADVLLEMARSAKDPAGIAASIASYRRVLRADLTDRPRVLANLTLALLAWARHTGNLDDLDEAIMAIRATEREFPPDDPRRANVVQNLGVALQQRYDRTGDPASLDESLRWRRQALLEPAQPDDVERPARLSGLCIALGDQYERTRDPRDLDESISYGRQAVQAAERLATSPSGSLSMLALALVSRYEATGQPRDLDEAIGLHRAAVGQSPSGDSERPMYLHNLGIALKARYRSFGRPEDLDDSIRAARDAVAGSTGPDRALRLSGLGTTLLDRYERTGELSDLNEAVQAERAAADMAPAGDARRAEFLANLGLALRLRFERTGDDVDIDAAVAAGREATAATVHDHVRGRHLTNLSSSLQVRFLRKGDPADLTDAVAASEAAVAACPEPHPDRAGALSVLGLALRARDEAGREARTAAAHPDEADGAVAAARQSVAVTPAGDVMLPGRLSNLAAALHARFRVRGQGADVAEAVRTVRAALELYPDGHPERAICLSNLGHFLHDQSRPDRAGERYDPELLRQALTAWRQGSQLRTAAARSRLVCAVNWARTARDAGLAAEAEAGYTAIVAMLPLVAWRGLNRAAQESQLALWGRLTTEAAAAAITAGHAGHAVELLEQGRAILWSQLLQTRDQTDALRVDYPDLGKRLDVLRAALDGQPGGAALPAEQRMNAAAEWDRMIETIRALPGYETFLSGPSLAELCTATAAGPVVIVNISRQRCDALVISPRGVQVIPLAALTQADADHYAEAFLQGVSQVQREAVDAILAWLWSAVAEPVLRALELIPPPESPARGSWRLPRIWWCPTGAMTHLPIHAAAPGPAAPGAIDHVVSSYIPTLRTLRDVRQVTGQADSAPDRLLLVTMPETQGNRPLRGAVDEAAMIGDRIRGVTTYSGQDARTGPVAAAVAGHKHVHFACHGGIDPDHPDQSGLQLHDGVLTISALSRVRRWPAGLAFLSACQTAAGSTRHPDEAMTMGAAMHVAGFQHVIATLWNIYDSIAPDMASYVYGALSGRDGRLTLDDTARALNAAAREVRGTGRHALQWAPYLHSGPLSFVVSGAARLAGLRGSPERRRVRRTSGHRSASRPALRAARRPTRRPPRRTRQAPGPRALPCRRSVPRSGCRWSARR